MSSGGRGRWAGPLTRPPSACRSASIDLVLLIDGSKSVRPQNFELVKKFVNQVGEFPSAPAGGVAGST